MYIDAIVNDLSSLVLLNVILFSDSLLGSLLKVDGRQLICCILIVLTLGDQQNILIM